MLPPEYLAVLLHDARALGYAFEAAWPQAAIRAAAIGEHPGDWLTVLAGTRDAWERAYENGPAPVPERALSSLGDDRTPDRALDARRCEWCNRWIATDRDPRARFCDDSCRRRHNYAVEKRRTEGVSIAATVASTPLEQPGGSPP